MPFDANGELKLEGAVGTTVGIQTVREVAERLQRHYDMRMTTNVKLTAWEASAVLNVLIGKAPPVDTAQEEG